MIADPVAPNQLWLPHLKKSIVRPWFIPSKEHIEEMDNLLKHSYFLVRQGNSFGERLRCKRCNRKEDYITLNCIPRPFSGVIGGLYAYYSVIGDNHLEGHLTDNEKARLHSVQEMLGDIPDISELHPETARKLREDLKLGPSDLQTGGLALGILEGIPEVYAKKLVDKINDRGLKPKLVLEAATWR